MSERATRLRPLRAAPSVPADPAAIAERVAARDQWLRWRHPRYQVEMISDLASLLPAGPCKILDIGAGSGLIGETISALCPGKSIVGVDIARRTRPDLSVPFVRFDGARLPFADGSFDCAMLCNMLHHVKPGGRGALLREALRVTGGGPLLLKDHVTGGALDNLRLWILDVLGNVRQGGMVSATYLDYRSWEELLGEVGCIGGVLPARRYRTGLWALCFPNRMEICLRVSR